METVKLTPYLSLLDTYGYTPLHRIAGMKGSACVEAIRILFAIVERLEGTEAAVDAFGVGSVGGCGEE